MICPICKKVGPNAWSERTRIDGAPEEIVVDTCMCKNRSCEKSVEHWPWFLLCKSGNIYKWNSPSMSWKLFTKAAKDSRKIGGYRVIQ